MAEKYSVNACSAMGNKIVFESNLLYFIQKYGESSETFKRARELLTVLSGPGKDKIKHAYVKPDMFGYQVEPHNTTWINYRTFIEAVVLKEEKSQTCLIAYYRPLVSYLLREGVPKEIFDSRYVCVGRSNFRETFRNLYKTIEPDYHTFRSSLERLQKDLNYLVNTWEGKVFEDIVFQIVQKKLLEGDPLKHFDLDHCTSLSNVAPGIRIEDQIEESSLGRDIKREIKRKLTLVNHVDSNGSDKNMCSKNPKLE